jgi:hypothetical protein
MDGMGGVTDQRERSLIRKGEQRDSRLECRACASSICRDCECCLSESAALPGTWRNLRVPLAGGFRIDSI